MIEREFEEYLALLKGLLRLRRKQCDAIADELRDHMDARLEDLLAEGVPRERAVQIALEEFGDAAGVGQAFIEVNRTNQRRWAMRVTAGSLLGISALALLTMAFWPEGNGSGQNRVLAQGGAGTPAASMTEGGGQSKEENNAITAAKLDRFVEEFHFTDNDLEAVAEYIKQTCGVNVIVDFHALEESGVDPNKILRMDLKQVRLETALELILKQLGGASYYIHDGIVIITSDEKLTAVTEVRVYNVADLVYLHSEWPLDPRRGPGMSSPGMPGMGPGPHAMGEPGGAPMSTGYPGTPSDVGQGQDPAARPGLGSSGFGAPPGGIGGGMPGGRRSGQIGSGMPGGAGGGTPSPKAVSEYFSKPSAQYTPEERRTVDLIRGIVAAVETDSWSEHGGSGEIQPFEGLLIVRNTPKAHQGVEMLLKQIRAARQLPRQGVIIGAGPMGGGFSGGSAGGGPGEGGFSGVPGAP